MAHTEFIQTPDVSAEAFTQLIAQGRGRAALILQSNEPAPYKDALLDASLRNITLRWFGNGDRVDYLLRLLELAGLREAAREAILGTARDADRERDREQRVDLLGAMALTGDAVARDALLARAEEGDQGAQDCLADADHAGLQWVVENVLPGLDPSNYHRISNWLPGDEADDVTSLQRRLRGLYREWEEHIRQESQVHVKPRLTASGFLRELDGKPGPYVGPFMFDRLASMRHWRIAARRFLREQNQKSIRSLAKLYDYDDFPLPLRRLFRQATHPGRGWAVMKVLGTERHPAVRRFALGLLRRRPLPWNALEAITANLRRSDEPLVLSALYSLEGRSPRERHNAAIDVLSFMKKHPTGGWQAHAEWVLTDSATAYGRKLALEWLAQHGTVPAWFLDEAPFDAEPDIRKSVECLRSH